MSTWSEFYVKTKKQHRKVPREYIYVSETYVAFAFRVPLNDNSATLFDSVTLCGSSAILFNSCAIFMGVVLIYLTLVLLYMTGTLRYREAVHLYGNSVYASYHLL